MSWIRDSPPALGGLLPLPPPEYKVACSSQNFLLSTKKDDAILKATDFGLSRFFTDGKPLDEIVGSPFYVAPEVRPGRAYADEAIERQRGGREGASVTLIRAGHLFREGRAPNARYWVFPQTTSCYAAIPPPHTHTQVLQRRYGKEADIWSCGVILYILLCGYPPFHGDSTQQIFKHIISQPLDLKSDPWPRISEGAKVRRGTRREPLEQGRVGGVDGEGGKGLSAGDTGSEGT